PGLPPRRRARARAARADRPRDLRRARCGCASRREPSGGNLAVLGQCRTDDALGDTGLVEMLRHAAEEERPAGAEDQARVDIRRLVHDALVEQVADLVGDRFERGLAYLLDAAPRVAGDD